MNETIVRLLGFATLAACLGTAAPAAAQTRSPPAKSAAEWEAVLAAEDARARTPETLAVLLGALNSGEPALRASAVRALGRLERADVVLEIAPLLDDPAPDVRSAAALALALAGRADASAAYGPLAASLERERVALVRAALAEALGRVRHDDAARAAAAAATLASLLAASPAERLGAVRGLHFLARQPAARSVVGHDATTGLRTLLAQDPEPRVRSLAMATLAVAGVAEEADLATVLGDRDPFVRREAAVAALSLPDTAGASRILYDALGDDSHVVRFEALRTWGRRFAATHGCAPLTAAVRDAHVHVATHALELFAAACVPAASEVELLDSLAASLPPDDGRDWHLAAHALVALAAHAPDRAARRLGSFRTHPSPFVRGYAARAAAAVSDTSALLAFLDDVHPNVRTEAVIGLGRVAGPAAHTAIIAQLAHDDSQLLQRAAAALHETDHPAALAALFASLDRMTARRRETERDARRALLDAIRRLGTAADAERLRPHLADYDPVIAELAAEIIGTWTGDRPEPRPVAPPALPRPSFEQVAALDGATLRIEMVHGTIELRLHAFDAPTNVARFARLAEAGYYDGLTLHRVVPNFVVQGGSPNANEYAGDGPFTRDELGRANWRGTAGLSTRGRDTGDAQLYINTVDNVRLDLDYTIWAEVVCGLEVVDAVREGDVMRRVRVIR